MGSLKPKNSEILPYRYTVLKKESIYICTLKGFGKIQTKFLTLIILGSGAKQNGEEGIREKQKT